MCAVAAVVLAVKPSTGRFCRGFVPVRSWKHCVFTFERRPWAVAGVAAV